MKLIIFFISAFIFSSCTEIRNDAQNSSIEIVRGGDDLMTQKLIFFSQERIKNQSFTVDGKIFIRIRNLRRERFQNYFKDTYQVTYINKLNESIFEKEISCLENDLAPCVDDIFKFFRKRP